MGHPGRLATCTLTVLMAVHGAGADVLNNGSSPPDPDNVTDDTRYGNVTLHVRNVGCPPGGAESDPFPAPGAATEAEYSNFAIPVLWALHTRDSSSVTVDGGRVRTSMCAYDGSSLTVLDGVLSVAAQGTVLCAVDASTVVVHAGTFDAGVFVSGSSQMTVNGGTFDSFSHFGSPVVDTATLVVNGGDIDLGLSARDQGSVTINNGSVELGSVDDDATFDVTGGFVSTFTQVSGTATFSGGAVSLYRSAAGLSPPGQLFVTGGSHSLFWLDEPIDASLQGGTADNVIATPEGADARLEGIQLSDFARVLDGSLEMSSGSVANDVEVRGTGSFLWTGGSIGTSLIASQGAMDVVGTASRWTAARSRTV